MKGDAGHHINRVLDKKRIIGKMDGQGGGKAQGVIDPKK
jgi:hypothetical protein